MSRFQNERIEESVIARSPGGWDERCFTWLLVLHFPVRFGAFQSKASRCTCHWITQSAAATQGSISSLQRKTRIWSTPIEIALNATGVMIAVDETEMPLVEGYW